MTANHLLVAAAVRRLSRPSSGGAPVVGHVGLFLLTGLLPQVVGVARAGRSQMVELFLLDDELFSR